MTRIMGDGGAVPQVSGAFRQNASGVSDHSRQGKKPTPFSLRLTDAERAALEGQAGSMPLGAYIRARLLEDAEHPRCRRRKPVKDDAALARLLGELGNARLANNLNQLARAANTGSLAVTPETVKAILSACQDVQFMRTCLLAALGFRPEERR